ncbi:MAG TPA: hypothetical protein VLA21_01970, partial [Candidatus Limnocylindria bacterium]|nr:hypothetical protein [Candidatus Limnocylindria bacterium]
KVNAATEDVKPELDDEFAQDVSEHQTFEEYRAAIVKELEAQRDEHAEAHLEDSLVQQAVDAADCDIPDAMVNRESERLVQNMRMQMLYQGIRMEDYLQYTNSTEESLREQFKAEARNNVKTQLVLEAIAKQEGLEAADEDVDKLIDERAKGTRDPQAYKDSVSAQQRENYAGLARTRKTVELLKQHAEITLHEGEHHELDADEVISGVQSALEQAESAEEDADGEAEKEGN